MNCRRNSYRMSATQGALNDCSTPHLGVQANYFLKYMQKKKKIWIGSYRMTSLWLSTSSA